MSDYDVIVVGAGYGGAAVAGLLAHEGRRVLLVDRNRSAGGKIVTLRSGGYVYEPWGAVGVPAAGSRFHELVDRLGLGDEVEMIVPEGAMAESWFKGPDGTWRHSIGGSRQTDDPAGVDRLREMYGADDAGIEAMVRMFVDVMTLSDEQLDALDDVGMLEWMSGFGLPDGLVANLASSLNLLFVSPVNRIPVSEAARTLRQIVEGGAGRYHVGGYARVAEACTGYVERRGGRYLPGTDVEQVLVEGGRVVGVDTSAGRFTAPVVISNAGIQPTVLRLVGADHLPAGYVERVQGLQPSWAIVGTRYFLDAPVFTMPIVVVSSESSWWDDERYEAARAGRWPEVPLMSIGVPCLFDPDTVPEGHQVAITAVLGSPDPADPMNDEAVRRSEVTLAELWPDLFDHVIRREVYTADHVSRLSRDSVVPGQGGEAIGLAQVIGQCGRSKPDPRTPLAGLYLVGCDAGGVGSGTHQAVDSAFRVADMVLADTRG